MKAVILAAGEGNRLRPLTTQRPKPMLPVANKPILEHVIEAVVAAGVDEIVLVVGYKRNRIQTYFGDGDEWDIDIEYVVQENQLGTGHAVQQAQPLVEAEFLVLNGDRIINASLIEKLLETRNDGEATVSVTRVDSPQSYGLVEADDDELRRIEEKPTGEPQSSLINAGVYRFTEEIFEAITDADRSQNGEIGLSSAITGLATVGHVPIVRYHGRWLDVTYPWDLLSVNSGMIPDNAGTSTDKIHGSATVAETVRIGPGTSIGPHAVIKQGTSIGPNVTIGANAVVSNSVIMQDATIMDGAVVRDCIVDENTRVGANTTVSGGTGRVIVDESVHTDVPIGGVIGANSMLGGGVVLEPGTIIGDDVTVSDGLTLTGRVDSNATVQGK